MPVDDFQNVEPFANSSCRSRGPTRRRQQIGDRHDDTSWRGIDESLGRDRPPQPRRRDPAKAAQEQRGGDGPGEPALRRVVEIGDAGFDHRLVGRVEGQAPDRVGDLLRAVRQRAAAKASSSV
jgi:hypothetical protein